MAEPASNTSTVEVSTASADKKEKETTKDVLQLPLARVRRIIKTDPDVKSISTDACFLVAKATELFLEQLVSQAYEHTAKGGGKSIQYKDLAKCVRELDPLEFLNDIIPEKRSDANL